MFNEETTIKDGESIESEFIPIDPPVLFKESRIVDRKDIQFTVTRNATKVVAVEGIHLPTGKRASAEGDEGIIRLKNTVVNALEAMLLE